MGGVSDRGEDVVYPNSPQYPEYGYVPPPPAPAPVPGAAPPPVAPPPVEPAPAHPGVQDFWANLMAQAQKKADYKATGPIPWGLAPLDTRQQIQFQGNRAMAGIPDQGPSPQFSAGYDELMKKAYPS